MASATHRARRVARRGASITTIAGEHSPGDLVVGALLGAVLGAAFALKASKLPLQAAPTGGEQA